MSLWTVYLDLDDTLIRPEGVSFTFRPDLVRFLKALHAEGIACRWCTNHCVRATHDRIADMLETSECPVAMPFPTRAEFVASGCSTLEEWRRACPDKGFVRMAADDFLHKTLSTYLGTEDHRGILVDNDVAQYWVSNLGHFVPALKASPRGPNDSRERRCFEHDWETGLMDRVLPAILAIVRADADANALPPPPLENWPEDHPLRQRLASHPRANALWHNTKVAFAACSDGVIAASYLAMSKICGGKGVTDDNVYVSGRHPLCAIS